LERRQHRHLGESEAQVAKLVIDDPRKQSLHPVEEAR
jgi:hypothetical protein